MMVSRTTYIALTCVIGYSWSLHTAHAYDSMQDRMFVCGLTVSETLHEGDEAVQSLAPFITAYETLAPDLAMNLAEDDQIFLSIGCPIDDFHCLYGSGDEAAILAHESLSLQWRTIADGILSTLTDEAINELEEFAALNSCDTVGNRHARSVFSSRTASVVTPDLDVPIDDLCESLSDDIMLHSILLKDLQRSFDIVLGDLAEDINQLNVEIGLSHNEKRNSKPQMEHLGNALQIATEVSAGVLNVITVNKQLENTEQILDIKRWLRDIFCE